LETEITKLENGRKSDDIGSIKSALKSIRTICEGAAGNIAADGIVALIKNLL
jgi:hypothetical protein